MRQKIKGQDVLLEEKQKICEVYEFSIWLYTQNRKLGYLGKRSLSSNFDSYCNLIFRNDKNEVRQKFCPVPKIEKLEILERFLLIQIFTVVVTCSKFVYFRERGREREGERERGEREREREKERESEALFFV